MSKSSSLVIRPPLPREHGAWAMFAAPLLIGIGVARKLSVEVLLFALVVFGFFLLRYPLMLAIKSRAPHARADAVRWSVIYGIITILSGAMLLIVTQLWLLIPLGVMGLASLNIYLWLASRREEMTTMGEWIGIAGLALSAPGAYLIATQSLNATALELYALNLLYFGGTVFYIKFKVREQPRAVPRSASFPTRLWAGRMTMAYHAAIVVAIGVLAFEGWISAIVWIAFALPFCKVVNGVLTRPIHLNIPRLGFVELAFTFAFALIVVVAYLR